MCVRLRKKPLPLEKLEMIILRLHPQHPKLSLLKKRAARYEKGWKGEQKLDFHLKSLPSQFAILNDVTLRTGSQRFQIDSLIYSPYAVYIIEVKNFEGPVTFNTMLNQFIQHNGEQLTGYKYPLTQVEIIQFHLQNWLEEHELNGLPIYRFIAFAEPSTIYHVVGDGELIRDSVCYADEIPLRLMKIESNLRKKNAANNPLKSNLIRTTIRACEDFDYDVLNKFEIKKEEIRTGVYCPTCKRLGMERIHGKGQCYKCGAFSKDAYNRALYEYAMLISPIITNKACRHFLQLNDRHEANYILKNQTYFTWNGRHWIRK